MRIYIILFELGMRFIRYCLSILWTTFLTAYVSIAMSGNAISLSHVSVTFFMSVTYMQIREVQSNNPNPFNNRFHYVFFDKSMYVNRT